MVVCVAGRFAGVVERFFLVVAVLLVDFFGAAFTAVFVAGFGVTLLVVLAGAFVVVVFVERLVGAADANIKGFVFFGGAFPRTCLIAFTCSVSVIRNSWWPSRVATK